MRQLQHCHSIHASTESQLQQSRSRWRHAALQQLAQLRLRHAVPVLVMDFDDTLTQGDTVGTLIDAAIAAQARDVADAAEHEERVSDLRALKTRLVREYVDAFEAVIDRHLPREGLARERGLDMEVASGFLDDMNDFEQRMNTKIIQSGILTGLQVCTPAPPTETVRHCVRLHSAQLCLRRTCMQQAARLANDVLCVVAQEADIEVAARRVALRPHARETLKAALQRGWPVHVVSVNWSARLIRATLAGIPCRIAHDSESRDSDDGDGDGKCVTIHANRLEMQLGISTGA
jgi:phosphoserine phosphatase